MIYYPTVSPHVGSTPLSHIKLPTNAQTPEINKVAGINTEVAIITGRANIRRSSMCVYATNALMNVRIVNMGTVCNRVVYGNVIPYLVLVFLLRKRRTTEKITHRETPVHQTAVHIESWYFRRRLGMCRGSGRENTSSGLVRPSRGKRDSVRDKETGSRLVVGGGGGGSGRGGCMLIASGRKKLGGELEPLDSRGEDGEGERVRERDCRTNGEAR
jgi:hypothetical protein